MVIEAVHGYLGARLPLDLNAQQHFRLLRTVFILVFASTLVIHLLLGHDQALKNLLVHATIIGLVYTVGIGLATAFIFALRKAVSFVYVWHIWAASLAGFLMGYYVLPFEGMLAPLPWFEPAHYTGVFGFMQLAPVWLLVTYLLIHPYLEQGLKFELAELREINDMLERRGADAVRPGQTVEFTSGKTVFSLDTTSIRNIVVDDHYCYLHYRQGLIYAKRELAMPLRDVLTLLPADFVQVHRSHVVNLQYITSVARRNRRDYIKLDGENEVPVSRHRLQDVMPLLQQRLEG